MSHYSQPPWTDDRPDPVRLLIRRNRKKILIGLVCVVILLLVAFIAVAIFFLTVIFPAGTGVARQAARSGEAGDAVESFINWIRQILNSENLMQWITLLQQFTN